MTISDIAFKLSDVVNNYFVFDMPDIEETAAANMEMLKTIPGCYDIINQLLDIIQEAAR